MNHHDMTRNMVLAALFAALTAIGAFLQIPTGTVPITLQFLFTALARRTGYLTVLAAVLVGDLILYAVGVPYMYLILHVYMQSAKTFPALLAAMLVYVPGDTLKIVVVTALAPVLRRTLAKAVPNL